jgi:hypothetical protein
MIARVFEYGIFYSPGNPDYFGFIVVKKESGVLPQGEIEEI